MNGYREKHEHACACHPQLSILHHSPSRMGKIIACNDDGYETYVSMKRKVSVKNNFKFKNISTTVTISPEKYNTFACHAIII